MKVILRWSTPVIAAMALLATAAASAQAAGPAGPAQPARTAASVPATFQPSAASFFSPSSGVVLGGVGCSLVGECRARLAATSNGGASWQFLPAPDVWLANHSPLVSQVVFASPRNGWLYDQYSSSSIWATHDGGAHWSRLSLPGDIRAMAASASTVYAVVGDQLYRSPAGSDRWARVGTMTAPSASLAVLGKAAWFGYSLLNGTGQLWATADGVHWHQYSVSCPTGTTLAGIAASSSTHVAFLCAFAEGMYHTSKAVLQSVNGGRTEYLTGTAPVPGDVYGFAVPPLRSKVVAIAAVTPGLDYVYRSGDSGKKWASISITGTAGGIGLDSLQFASPQVGWLVVSHGWLLRTSNTGRTWHKVSF